MDSQPQSLHPAVPCTSPAGTGGPGLAGSPDKGSARPKPPVRPKPRVLPKPAVPTKPPVPPPAPGPRHPRPELPSAEKMNRLAGPQPYSAAGTGGPLRRPSFTVRSPETPNGKGLPSPLVAGTEEEVPAAPPTPSRKGPAPFKVTPVPVAARPERFPGTTVEEILAKMDSREGPGSPDRAWLSPFCTDPSSRFGSKTFAAFRKRPSGEADGDPAGEAPQTPRPAAGELGVEDDGHPVAEMSSSPPTGLSCAGDPRRRPRPPSPPDLSTLQLGALGPPGSPRPPSCPAPAPAPGAPFQPAEPSAPAPGSPDAAAELLAPDSPTLPPGFPESPTRPPVEVPVTSIQAPGAPSATEPQHSISHSPGSPHTPGEGSPGTASPPGTPELPPRVTCPPGSPEAAAEYLGFPSPPLAKASCPPGSPEGPDDSAVSPLSHEGPDFKPPPRDVGLRRSSEGVLRPPPTGQGLGELGGSLSALPHPGDLLSEPSLGSESGWSLSQSFEWTFPSRGTRLPAFPPRSPIRETPDSGLSEEGESDGEAAAPSPPKDSSSEGPDSQQAEGAPCPGGPVAQREAEGSAEEEEEDEREAEQDAPVSHSPLHVTKPGQDPAEPESPTQPSVTTPLDPAPPDLAAPADLAWAGDSPKSLQGPGGPGQAEGPSQDPDPHTDPGWLTELLASPGVRGSPEQNLLGWSRKDLCSEFGIGHPRQDTTFDWSHPGVSRERDWPVETKQDQDFETKSSWDSTRGDKDSNAPESWSGDYRATELMRDMKLGCSDWSQSLGTGKSCPQDPDFSASTAKWGQGYGSTEELGSGQANWSSGLGTGHVQQLDKEPRSGQPTWAGRFSNRDTEMKDRELTPDWASKYSSQDAGSKEENLTLGWAGRSSTGDTGSPDKELSPGQTAWDRRCDPRDMESQDWEFSPCRPAWTSEYRDTESQDQEFSPSRPAWTGEIRDMESQDREFSPGRPAWTGEYREMESQDQKFSPRRQSWNDRSSTKDMESQDQEFSPSRPAWDDRSRTRDTERQDREFSPSRPAWDDGSSTRDTESQDQEFSPSRLAWGDRSSTRDVKSQDQEFSPSRPAWDDRSRTRDTERQDREFSSSRPAWDDKSRTRDTESQDQEFSPSRAAWDDGSRTRDTERQDREFSSSRPAWDDRSSTRDTERQDREFSSSRPAWDDRSSTRDTEKQDREFSPSRPAWDDKSSTRDTESQDQEFSPSRPAWDDRSRTRDTERQDREFSSSRPAWDDRSSARDTEIQDREFSSSRPAWDDRSSTRDTERQDREFSPSRPAWDDKSRTRDTESQDQEFSPSRLAEAREWSTRDLKTQDTFSPSRAAWDDGSRTSDTERQDSEFSPSRPAWDDRSSTRDTESQDQEFSPSRLAEAREWSTRDLETQDAFSPSRAAWDGGSSTRDLESQDHEFTSSRAAVDGRHSIRDTETQTGELFSPSRGVWGDRSSTRAMEPQDRAARDGQRSSVAPREEEQELMPARLSWPGEGSIGQTGLVGVGEEDVPNSHHPDLPVQEPTWGSAHLQERDSSGSRDWAEELGAAEYQNQFGVIGTERLADPCGAGASDGSMSRVLPQPQAGLHRDLSLDMGSAHWSQDLDSWSVEPRDSEARRQEWASAFSARCAARSRDLGAEEQSLGGATSAEHGSTPSPLMDDIPAHPSAVEPPQSESPNPSEEERDPSEPTAAPQSPRTHPLLSEASSGIPADTGSEEQPSDHPDGECSSSCGEQRHSLATPQPEGSMEQGQEFPLLEDTELLDSSVLRCKASLGRKRQHRAPSLRPATTEGESWIFRDSTEPRPAPAASSDEEAVEEPRSRRMRGSPSGRGVKVPLFPGLSASAIKAKLRGRNRSAEEGTSSGESKGTPPKDPHVQRSKSCKIPGVSGKPPTLPPKPEKSSGSEASPPHWLQALKLKRKKP
ncbi:182 kDa tankyrase-1-binding protein isoform X2 [Oenanthe melanoleuca]|uniref:182 kDa tankyrase-1-binding protein isoform X2 n=1 Tax=Oenanthe melanoleuca TaxID=2939378 RepID=UPI0024C1595B|nr:182 kDa tankyrase-1-binding protein isoform X2 [Oenanthe melanoleuca]